MIDDPLLVSASCGFGAGIIFSVLPGIPGSGIALVGLAIGARLSSFAVVDERALMVATLFTLYALVVQVTIAGSSSRAWGGTAGSSSGAVVGSIIGLGIPLPGLSLLFGVFGAVLGGLWGWRQDPTGVLKGWFGASIGCFYASVIDFVGVVSVIAVFAVSVWQN